MQSIDIFELNQLNSNNKIVDNLKKNNFMDWIEVQTFRDLNAADQFV